MVIDEQVASYFKNVKQVFLYLTDKCDLRCKQCLYKPNLILEKEIGNLQETALDARREVNISRIRAEEIGERAEHIKTMKTHLDKLKQERRSMSFFRSKKEIDGKILLDDKMKEKMEHYLETYGIM